MFHTVLDPGADGVGVAFTDRLDGFSAPDIGPLNLGRTDADDICLVERNLDAVRDRLGLGAGRAGAATEAVPLIALHQVHGTDVLRVDADLLATWGPRSHLGEPAGQAPLPVADAAVTALPRVALCVRVADCVPVLLADRDTGVIGAAHAGRAGFAAGVLPATVEAMHALGAREVQAWIGPHICGSCYEVPQAMADEVTRNHPDAITRSSWGTPALDLGAGCAAQLARLGVHVERLDPCTRTNPQFHSHRRDGVRAGRQAGIIWRIAG